jgi:hypothetical protein
MIVQHNTSHFCSTALAVAEFADLRDIEAAVTGDHAPQKEEGWYITQL